MEGYKYGERLQPTWYNYTYGGWPSRDSYFTTYWNNQGTMAPPFDPKAHFESPYYWYDSNRWSWNWDMSNGFWGWDGFIPRWALLAQNGTNSTSETQNKSSFA